MTNPTLSDDPHWKATNVSREVEDALEQKRVDKQLDKLSEPTLTDRCIQCGQFVNPETASANFTPDTHFTAEKMEFTCQKCESKLTDDQLKLLAKAFECDTIEIDSHGNYFLVFVEPDNYGNPCQVPADLTERKIRDVVSKLGVQKMFYSNLGRNITNSKRSAHGVEKYRWRTVAKMFESDIPTRLLALALSLP